MEYKDRDKYRVDWYMTRAADEADSARFEDDMLTDAALMQRFVAACEAAIRTAPPFFSETVMDKVKSPALPTFVKTQTFNKKLCAAACFCSAAAIALLSVTGFERQLIEFISNQSGRFYELVSAIISRL